MDAPPPVVEAPEHIHPRYGAAPPAADVERVIPLELVLDTFLTAAFVPGLDTLAVVARALAQWETVWGHLRAPDVLDEAAFRRHAFLLVNPGWIGRPRVDSAYVVGDTAFAVGRQPCPRPGKTVIALGIDFPPNLAILRLPGWRGPVELIVVPCERRP